MNEVLRTGPFCWVEQIARGGMGQIWRGYHAVSGARSAPVPVAIKVLTDLLLQHGFPTDDYKLSALADTVEEIEHDDFMGQMSMMKDEQLESVQQGYIQAQLDQLAGGPPQPPMDPGFGGGF